ncbi:hypothetical protein [Verrucomicrobium spinosum]|uniref:hypothetical protein n=1 Tax=Verrucomicrobium spinosum TaxID=2736 RepID=UPI0001745C03|nr:hypothetical protein [Verrucomicrobium spinosum]
MSKRPAMNVTEALGITLAVAETVLSDMNKDCELRPTLHRAIKLHRARFYRMNARLQSRRRRDASRPKCLR